MVWDSIPMCKEEEGPASSRGKSPTWPQKLQFQLVWQGLGRVKSSPEQALASFQPVGELLTMCQVQAQLVCNRELGSKEARLSCWQRNKVPTSLLL